MKEILTFKLKIQQSLLLEFKLTEKLTVSSFTTQFALFLLYSLVTLTARPPASDIRPAPYGPIRDGHIRTPNPELFES